MEESCLKQVSEKGPVRCRTEAPFSMELHARCFDYGGKLAYNT